MCAIIGFISKQPTVAQKAILRELFYHSRIRGLHAFGFAAYENGKTYSYKSHTLQDLFSKVVLPQALIGHCRYSTSGDYANHVNNQPVEYNGEHLVFNGVIDMRTRPEMEAAHNIRMKTDNDGEIILQANDRNKIVSGSASFAGLFLKGNQVTFLRNEKRPAYIAVKDGATYIASTRDILKRCNLDPCELQTLRGYVWTV